MAISVRDDDGILNPSDPMGDKTATWTFPNIPTGTDLYVTVNNVAGCSERLFFNITKGAEVFTAPPPMAGEAAPPSAASPPRT